MKPLLAILLLALPLRAAIHTAASASRADVGAKVTLAVDGDTVIIPAGTASWHSTLTITKAITLQGAGIGSTILIDDITTVSPQQLVKWQTETGKSYRMTGIEFRRALRDVTGDAATNVIICTAHELAVNDAIRFVSASTRDPDDIPIVGGAGITGVTVYVKTVPTANTFTFSATLGGAEFDFTTDITAGQYWRAKLGYPHDEGSFTVSGPSNAIRFDHCRFYNLQNEYIKWYNSYGVIDHCDFVMNALTGSRVLMFSHRSHNGVTDNWGDIDWETSVDWMGDRKAVYMEDCTTERFDTNSATLYGICDAITGGGRAVFRYNTIGKGRLGNHGTETSTRYRGGRMIEAYGNTFNNAYDVPSTVVNSIHARSGTVIAWNNRFTGLFNANVTMDSYRRTEPFYPWGIADGTKAWDTPDLTDDAGTPGGAGDGVFDTGAATAVANNSLTDSTKAWTTNQWAAFAVRTNWPFTATSGTATTVTVAGATWTTDEWRGYEFTRNSDNAKGYIIANTANTLTFYEFYYRPSMAGGGNFVLSKSGLIATNTSTALTTYNGVGSSSPRVFKSGAAYEIRKVGKVLDDSGLGVTTHPIGTDSWPNHQSLNQGMDPCYLWDNLKRSTAVGAWTDSVIQGGATIKENRNYYKYTATFDGTVGVGVGTLAARPVTCTTGVGYWATDQGEWNSTNGATPDGQLYVATATDTWGLHYVPYTYPHPLTSEEPVTPDTTAPTLVSATIGNIGVTLSLVFSENVTSVNSAHYALSSGTLSSAAGSGPSWTMTISPTVLLGDVRTLSYTAGSTVDTATSPNALANFAGAAVTNNSIQTSPLVPRRLTGVSIVGALMNQ